MEIQISSLFKKDTTFYHVFKYQIVVCVKYRITFIKPFNYMSLLDAVHEKKKHLLNIHLGRAHENVDSDEGKKD